MNLRFSKLLVLLFLCSCYQNDVDLVLAAGNNNLTEATNLLEAGHKPDVCALDGWTPMTAAASAGHFEMIELLIASGANVNIPEAGGNSPLFWSVHGGHLKTVQLLVENGADLEMSPQGGTTPLQLAYREGYLDIARVLVAGGAAEIGTEGG